MVKNAQTLIFDMTTHIIIYLLIDSLNKMFTKTYNAENYERKNTTQGAGID